MIPLAADQMKVLESAIEIGLLRFTYPVEGFVRKPVRFQLCNFIALDIKLISLKLLLTCLSSIGYERDEAVLFSFFS